jgi:hypothetical protein
MESWKQCGLNDLMAYYLNANREEDVAAAYRKYRQYLEENKTSFPASVFDLASSDWYFDPNDHRCPHDGRLESVTISESAQETQMQKRETSVRIRLCGAYNDLSLEFLYSKVSSYSLASGDSIYGLGDWRFDEFTLDHNGHVVHEIEWAGFAREEGSRWIICAAGVQFNWMSL